MLLARLVRLCHRLQDEGRETDAAAVALAIAALQKTLDKA
jgi:hypothetical protein